MRSRETSFAPSLYRVSTDTLIMALCDILPNEHMKCWQYFVQASRILCQLSLTSEQIQLADAFLLQFCKRAESLYGKSAITPNMHLHCHLKESLFDYGPIHNFWLFSYERYNGILEHFPSNNRSLEIHLMTRFMQECSLYSNYHLLPSKFSSDFDGIFQEDMEPVLKGSLQVTIHGNTVNGVDPSYITDWSIAVGSEEDISFPKSYCRTVLSDDRLSQLKQIYAFFYPHLTIQSTFFNSSCRKFSNITYKGIRYKEQSLVYVTNTSFMCGSNSTNLAPRPVMINYFIIHSYQSEDAVFEHVFAVVSWLKEHPAKSTYIRPFEIWWKDLYDSNLEDLVPLQLLLCHAVHCNIEYEGQTVCLTCPVHNIPSIT